jgi:hypothetical protein
MTISMKINDIKKTLYKEKPIAKLDVIRLGNVYYQTTLNNGLNIRFCIPVNDMGDADFYSEMDAKLLIRWLINE